MQWVDDAILLSIRKYGENKAVARVFSRTHGVFAGIVRGATSKTNRGHLQPGNAVRVTWQARLAEQMGTFKVEPVKPFSAFAMQDGFKLAALSSACALMETSLPERHPYPKLYGKVLEFLELLTNPLPLREGARGWGISSNTELDTAPLPNPPPQGGREFWQEEYVKLELAILAESGFGLDLSQCAATGTTENLIYVSPKSGRAVSAEAGEPYKEKLLPLPDFLRSATNNGRVTDGLTLTGYFLEHWLAEPHGKNLPAARMRLVEMLQKTPPSSRPCAWI